MKKLIAIIVLLSLTFVLVSCKSAENDENSMFPESQVSGYSDSSPTQTDNASSAQVNSAPSISDSASSSSSGGGSTLSEEEIKDISLKLYEEGYMPFLKFLWGGGGYGPDEMDWEDSFKYAGFDYYRYPKYATREELEDAFRGAFTDEFVKRNVDGFFEEREDGHLRFIERDGKLYRREPGGIGGTYRLAVETIEISAVSADGWTYTMNGMHSHFDGVDEALICTINIICEANQWKITDMIRKFTDGSMYIVY